MDAIFVNDCYFFKPRIKRLMVIPRTARLLAERKDIVFVVRGDGVIFGPFGGDLSGAIDNIVA